jgi:pyruvate dehydrogenase E1 component alpha subunit
LGKAYDMPFQVVDAMKCEPVHEAVEKAAARARKGEGPTFLEMATYRYKGHSMSDPQKYRTKKEVEGYKKLDPIETTLDSILKKKYATQQEIDEINARIDKEIEDCVAFAESSPYPDDSELYKDIYTQEDYPFLAE